MAGPGGGQMLDRPLLGALRRLDLTADQRQKVRTILMDARRQAAPRSAGAGTAPDFTALINPGDPDHARAVQAAKDRAAQRIERSEQTEQNLYNVLTAQQKTRLTQMFAQMRTRMQQREAARNAGPGAAAGQGATPPRGRADR
jgi:Spy/CpxP family protein refolding chaperone